MDIFKRSYTATTKSACDDKNRLRGASRQKAQGLHPGLFGMEPLDYWSTWAGVTVEPSEQLGFTPAVVAVYVPPAGQPGMEPAAFNLM